MPAHHVLILGGGVGGLAAAIRLAAQGVRVTLIEKNRQVGGKLNRWIADHPARPGERFTFDTGPSLLTLPFVFEALLRAAGTSLDRELRLVRLDPISRFEWADGVRFELRADEADTLEEVRRLSPADVEGWRAFMARGRRIWELAGELFLMNAPETLFRRRGLSPMDGLRLLSVPLRIGMFGRYARLVDRHVRHPRLRDVLYQYATYSGANPLRAPATLGVIPYAETGFGGWYIQGGMYELALALRRAGERLGVVFRTGCTTRRLMIRGETRVAGVVLESGEVIEAGAVLANSDVLYTYRALVDPRFRPHWPDAKIDRLDPGGSGLVLLLGVEGRYPGLAHHTKFMPGDYRVELRAMFEARAVPRDPCLYVCASTRTDPTQAPPGCENLFVLASAPPRFGRGCAIDWRSAGAEYRDRIVATLQNRFGLADLSRRILVERRFTPADLETSYNAHAGSIYGIGGGSRTSAFFRPPNRDPRLGGLYFAGAATHPGGGLPLVALSGKIASEMIMADLAGAARAC